jgi:glucose-6-phosphate isomerase, archaeal
MTRRSEAANLEFTNMMKMDWQKGLLSGASVEQSVKTLGQLKNIFMNEQARESMNPNTVVYRVQAWCPLPQGTEGAQFWGTTVIEPGLVDAEYFMTHGHFHEKRDRTEYYATIEGEGALILMDDSGKTWMEPMSPGTLHFIPPNVAHRVANAGTIPLRLVACWPSDAGHDYGVIRRSGFGARLLKVHGKPSFVRSDG